MVCGRKTFALICVLLAAGALACNVSVDLGGDKTPEEPPSDTATATGVVEPVKVSLLDADGEERVPEGAAVILTVAWTTDSPELIADYLDALDLVVTLDGDRLANPLAHFGPVEERGDRDEDGDTDYRSNWNYEVGVLSPGVHHVDAQFRLLRTVTDGFDEDQDGNLDQYSGEWSYQVRIIVTD